MKADEFLRSWFQKKWGVEPGILAFPEMKLDITLAQVCELMEAYKVADMALAGKCAFCGEENCDCPHKL